MHVTSEEVCWELSWVTYRTQRHSRIFLCYRSAVSSRLSSLQTGARTADSTMTPYWDQRATMKTQDLPGGPGGTGKPVGSAPLLVLAMRGATDDTPASSRTAVTGASTAGGTWATAVMQGAEVTAGGAATV